MIRDIKRFLRDPGAHALPVLLPVMVLVTVGPVPLFRRSASAFRLSEVYLLPLVGALCVAAVVLWLIAVQRRASIDG